MNIEKIDTMPRGDEIDAMIAEKVMGFALVRALKTPTGQDYNPHLAWSSIAPIAERKNLNLHEKTFAIPQYSLDIAAAWKVVEKMKPLRLWLINFEDYWQASFLNPDDSAGMKSNADTAPLAICRAALETMRLFTFYPIL